MSERNDDKRRDEERDEDLRSTNSSEDQLSMLIGRLPSHAQSNDYGYRPTNGYSGRSANYDLVNNA